MSELINEIKRPEAFEHITVPQDLKEQAVKLTDHVSQSVTSSHRLVAVERVLLGKESFNHDKLLETAYKLGYVAANAERNEGENDE